MSYPFGWSKKVDLLKQDILSTAHQNAQEIPSLFWSVFEEEKRALALGVPPVSSKENEELLEFVPPFSLCWKGLRVYDWTIGVTMYLRDNHPWWLVVADYWDSYRETPRRSKVVFLERILARLGANLPRDRLIGPCLDGTEETNLHFGWWTWENRWSLYEVQENARVSCGRNKARVGTKGTPESDGYCRRLPQDAECS